MKSQNHACKFTFLRFWRVPAWNILRVCKWVPTKQSTLYKPVWGNVIRLGRWWEHQHYSRTSSRLPGFASSPGALCMRRRATCFNQVESACVMQRTTRCIQQWWEIMIEHKKTPSCKMNESEESPAQESHRPGHIKKHTQTSTNIHIEGNTDASANMSLAEHVVTFWPCE